MPISPPSEASVQIDVLRSRYRGTPSTLTSTTSPALLPVSAASETASIHQCYVTFSRDSVVLSIQSACPFLCSSANCAVATAEAGPQVRVLTDKFFDLKRQSRFYSEDVSTFFRISRDSVRPVLLLVATHPPTGGYLDVDGKRNLPLLAWLSEQMLLALVRELAALGSTFRFWRRYVSRHRLTLKRFIECPEPCPRCF